MLIILSQKIDTESPYSDEPFNSYHYPARYRNQIHEGDVFVYYQGNRSEREHRYYFGVGTVGEILTTDGENYYAKLVNCQKFENKVPIYLPDGGYIEQLGYETVRKSITPPWQSSVCPISQRAYDYIISAAGIQSAPGQTDTVESLKEKLRAAIREFFVGNNSAAIHRVESIAAAIGRATNISENKETTTYLPSETPKEKLSNLLNYCQEMKMSYSYKPVLILALLHAGKNGKITIEKAADYVLAYYQDRKVRGLAAEKKKCIYLRDDVSKQQVIANLLSNPVKALCESGYFFYNENEQVFSLSPELWGALEKGSKAMITRICRQRLSAYYSE